MSRTITINLDALIQEAISAMENPEDFNWSLGAALYEILPQEVGAQIQASLESGWENKTSST